MLVIFFIVFILLFIKVYRDVNYAKEYVGFITDSTNSLIGSIEEANTTMSTLKYNESEDYVVELEGELATLESTKEEIGNNYSKFDVPYGGEEVDNKFKELLTEADNLSDALDGLIGSIKNLEKKEEFDAKLEVYIESSNSIQDKSSELEEVLNEYIVEYNKIDIRRVLHGIIPL